MSARKIVAWIVVLSALAVYVGMLTVTLPHLSVLAGGVPVFDLRPMGYTFQEAKDIISALGEPGRQYYLGVQQRFDTAFPVLNAGAVAIALNAAFSNGNWRLFRLNGKGHALLLAVISLPVALLDLLENLKVRELLLTAPAAVSPQAVATASAITIAKSLSVTAGYTLVLVALLVIAVDKIRIRQAKLNISS